MTKESWRTGDELSFREAKPEPARVMELEMPCRFQMPEFFFGFVGFEDFHKSERGMFLA